MNLTIFRKSSDTNAFGQRQYYGINESTGEIRIWQMIHEVSIGDTFNPYRRDIEIQGLQATTSIPPADVAKFLKELCNPKELKNTRPRRGNVYRHLLYKALAENGGYDKYPVAYTVKLWHVDSSVDAVYAAIEGEKPAMHPDLDWDADREYDWAQEDLYRGLKDWDSYKMLSPSVAKRYGIQTESPLAQIGKRFKLKSASKCYYPSKHPSFVKVVDDTPYDVKFTCEGRGGSHVCIDEFEGRDMRKFSKELLLDEDSSNYSNWWCQKLLAMMHEWETCLTSKSASADMMLAMSSSMEGQLAELNRESEQREYWNSRDVVTI